MKTIWLTLPELDTLDLKTPSTPRTRPGNLIVLELRLQFQIPVVQFLTASDPLTLV